MKQDEGSINMALKKSQKKKKAPLGAKIAS
jgi:hypothetical protein